jgi:hypothetical protein
LAYFARAFVNSSSGIDFEIRARRLVNADDDSVANTGGCVVGVVGSAAREVAKGVVRGAFGSNASVFCPHNDGGPSRKFFFTGREEQFTSFIAVHVVVWLSHVSDTDRRSVGNVSGFTPQ